MDELCMLDKTLENDYPHTVIAKLIVNDNELTVNVLLDTGALQNNYINEDTAGWITKHGGKHTRVDSRVCSAFNECVTINNSFKNKICFKVLDDNDSLEIDNSEDNIEYIDTEALSNKKRVMDEIRKPRKRQRTFRRKSESSLERVDSGVRVKSVRPNDFTRLQDTVLPLPNNN
jgi:hypothetical protein